MDLSNINQKIKHLKVESKYYELNDESIKANPFEQFIEWFDEALNSENTNDPTAMVLATVDENDLPDTRVVLLKEVAENKLIFYTHYQSNKAKQFIKNDRVAVNFYWPVFGRQVRIRGKIEKVDKKKSENYFATRPRQTQLNVHAWVQSTAIANREELYTRIKRIEEQFTNQSIPCPPNWGGYAVTPMEYEFFQSREWRMHDRFFYTLEENKWKVTRLAP